MIITLTYTILLTIFHIFKSLKHVYNFKLKKITIKPGSDRTNVQSFLTESQSNEELTILFLKILKLL